MQCSECEQEFEPRKAGRPQKFCSRKCFSKNYYRHPDDKKDRDKDRTCPICLNPFVQKKRHQRYCSASCYVKAWPRLNREANAATARRRRREKPEWYLEHEPIYASKYRSKLLSKKPWHYLLLSARSRAKEKGFEYDLTDEWASTRWNHHCEITGIKFRQNGKKGPHPFSPSIDRKDPTKGYTQDNTRFILWGCNAIKGVGTDADMFEIAKAIVATL